MPLLMAKLVALHKHDYLNVLRSYHHIVLEHFAALTDGLLACDDEGIEAFAGSRQAKLLFGVCMSSGRPP